MNYSKIIAAGIVLLLTNLANTFGLDMPSPLENLEPAIETLVAILAFGLLAFERWKKGGVTPLGFKE